MKGKLSKYIRKSSVMDISIKYGEDTVRFNLTEELKVDEARINHELKTQPSYYGFLTLLLNKVERTEADKKAELNRVYSELFIKYKSEIDPNTNRAYNNDLTESMVQTNEDYQRVLKAFNKAKEEAGIIKSCVEAFNQRSFLLQTLSANVRDEKRTI